MVSSNNNLYIYIYNEKWKYIPKVIEIIFNPIEIFNIHFTLIEHIIWPCFWTKFCKIWPFLYHKQGLFQVQIISMYYVINWHFDISIAFKWMVRTIYAWKVYLNFFNQMIIWIINEIKLNAHDSPQN
jgi:hypothetical protein